MTRGFLRLPEALGTAGLTALALLAAAALFHFAALQPLELRNEALKERLAREARPAAAAPASAADQLGAVYAFLERDEQTTDWLAKLHAIGAATGVQLSSASYRAQQAEGRIVRYEIVLPLAGSYGQIRDFLRRSAEEIPVMSIDQLSLKRENRNDPALQAELRLTLHRTKS
jgi:Tfp pilus assembly protein PilO